MPSGWYIQPDDETAIESEYWLYDEQHIGIMIAAFDLYGAQQFAAAMNAPRPADAALAAEVEQFIAAAEAAQLQLNDDTISESVLYWKNRFKAALTQQNQEGGR